MQALMPGSCLVPKELHVARVVRLISVEFYDCPVAALMASRTASAWWLHKNLYPLLLKFLWIVSVREGPRAHLHGALDRYSCVTAGSYVKLSIRE